MSGQLCLDFKSMKMQKSILKSQYRRIINKHCHIVGWETVTRKLETSMQQFNAMDGLIKLVAMKFIKNKETYWRKSMVLKKVFSHVSLVDFILFMSCYYLIPIF